MADTGEITPENREAEQNPPEILDDYFMKKYESYKKKEQKFRGEEQKIEKRVESAMNVFTTQLQMIVTLTGGGTAIIQGSFSCHNKIWISLAIMVPFVLALGIATYLASKKLERTGVLFQSLTRRLSALQKEVLAFKELVAADLNITKEAGDIENQRKGGQSRATSTTRPISHMLQRLQSFSDDVDDLDNAVNDVIQLAGFNTYYKATLQLFVAGAVLHAILIPLVLYFVFCHDTTEGCPAIPTPPAPAPAPAPASQCYCDSSLHLAT